MALNCPAKFCFDRNSGYILLLQIMSLLIRTIVNVSLGQRHTSLLSHRSAVLVSLLQGSDVKLGFASEKWKSNVWRTVKFPLEWGPRWHLKDLEILLWISGWLMVWHYRSFLEAVSKYRQWRWCFYLWVQELDSAACFACAWALETQAT